MDIEGTGAGADAHPWTQQSAAAGARVERDTDGSVLCGLSGDLDLDSLDAPRAVLEGILASGAPVLVVDLAEVTFCDSSGLNMLLQLRLAAQEAGVALRLGPVSEQVARLLEITGAGQVFVRQDSTDAAPNSG
ncbi:STAS domain-containing protein [Kitasatospora mediocidica]|uniref:STAS domain-containing protein n=1 Tax=Kitasatospora mediocidica TaxID=58352 RepID=UPI0006925A15|nr:STAS domain-containing protein [Kitasatospora mediocidica]